MGKGIVLSEAELRDLTDRVRSRTGRAEHARRARVIMLLAEGLTWDEVCERAECSRGFVALWARRFRAERLAGLYSRHRGQKPFRCTPRVEAKILNATRKPPTEGSTHWSTRRLAAKLGVSHMMVARVWSKHRLQPHRLERYMSSNDPNFEQKAADIIGLYLNPPAHAAVFCVDEKTAIQALDRNDPVLPLSPGRAERHGFEYYRHVGCRQARGEAGSKGVACVAGPIWASSSYAGEPAIAAGIYDRRVDGRRILADRETNIRSTRLRSLDVRVDATGQSDQFIGELISARNGGKRQARVQASR